MSHVPVKTQLSSVTVRTPDPEHVIGRLNSLLSVELAEVDPLTFDMIYRAKPRRISVVITILDSTRASVILDCITQLVAGENKRGA